MGAGLPTVGEDSTALTSSFLGYGDTELRRLFYCNVSWCQSLGILVTLTQTRLF